MPDLGDESRPLDVVDLRDIPDEGLLETFYREAYLPSFPIVSEQENPDVWRALLWDAGQPCELHCLVAGHDLAALANRRVLGGHLFEFYPHSACGLLTYLVVHPSARRRGLGSRLFRRGVTTLRQAARAAGSRLRRVFAEVDDPRRMRGRRHPIDPWERLRFFEGLGGRVLDLPYVQPELVPGQGRARHLLLLTMSPRTRARAVAAAPVREFLAEFYRALNVAPPEDDPDFRTMLAAVRNGRIPFLDVRRR